MPPKKDKTPTLKEQLELLCILMSTAIEFEPDFNAAAAALNIAQPRNITRKINAIIEPVGYTMRRKKLLKVTNGADDNTAGPSTPVKKRSSKTKAQSKKVVKGKTAGKIEGDSDDEDNEADDEEEVDGRVKDADADNDYSPVTRAILDATTGSDVTPDEDSNFEEKAHTDIKGKGKAT